MNKSSHPQSDQNHPHEHLPEGHPLRAFFECCLGEEPAALSEKIQKLRETLPNANHTEEIAIVAGEKIVITKDMIIGDVIFNFPQTKPLLEDLHPLGLLSPLLDRTTIELFFSDTGFDVDEICQNLTRIIDSNK